MSFLIESSLQHSIKRRVKRDKFESNVNNLKASDEKFKKFIKFSLAQLEDHRARPAKNRDINQFKYSLVEIVSIQFTKLIDNHIGYDLSIKIKQADCKQKCQIEKCSLKLLEKNSEEYNLTSFDCLILKSQSKLAEMTFRR